MVSQSEQHCILFCILCSELTPAYSLVHSVIVQVEIEFLGPFHCQLEKITSHVGGWVSYSTMHIHFAMLTPHVHYNHFVTN